MPKRNRKPILSKQTPIAARGLPPSVHPCLCGAVVTVFDTAGRPVYSATVHPISPFDDPERDRAGEAESLDGRVLLLATNFATTRGTDRVISPDNPANYALAFFPVAVYFDGESVGERYTVRPTGSERKQPFART